MRVENQGSRKASGALRFRRAPSLRMCEASVAVSPKLWPRCAAVSPKLWLHHLDYPFRSEFLNFMPTVSASRGSAPRSRLAEGGHVDAPVANMDDAWGTIEEIVSWLDDSSTLPPETEKLLRIMKLTEEAGEVTQAVVGTLGQNPRKGITHTWEDVQAELCDVIFTAMVALTTLTPDARQTFQSHLARVAGRSLSEPSATAAIP